METVGEGPAGNALMFHALTHWDSERKPLNGVGG